MSLFSGIRKHPVVSAVIILLIAVLVVARLYLGVWLLNYVNQVLDNINGYEGSVEAIDIDLYRGAYRIYKLKLLKKDGNIPTPFIYIETADLSIQWKALFHGRVVSNIELYKPVINFAVSKSGTTEQTGEGIDWTQPIKALAPIDINRVSFKDGKLSYQDFSANPKVNIYITNMNGEIRNLRNVEDMSQRLPSTLVLTGDSIGKGKLKINGRLYILKQVPDMNIDTQLENVNLTALNDYSNAYAAIDIRKGNLSVYSQLIVRDGEVSGYIKPIATDISLIDLSKSANPIKVAWESVADVILTLFTNLPHDQFATTIKLEGNLDHISTSTWSTISGILRNAFVSALKKGLDPGR